MQLRRIRRSLSQALIAFAISFGVFFCGFGLVATLVLLCLFFLGAGSGLDFMHFLMSGGNYRIYFAIASLAFFMGFLWFLVTLIDNLQSEEGKAKWMIDRWVQRGGQSDKERKVQKNASTKDKSSAVP